MKSIALPVWLVLALGACKAHEEEVDVDLSAVPCICGQPEAAFDGCSHLACLSGEGNLENPDCVCAPLPIEEGN